MTPAQEEQKRLRREKTRHDAKQRRELEAIAKVFKTGGGNKDDAAIVLGILSDMAYFRKTTSASDDATVGFDPHGRVQAEREGKRQLIFEFFKLIGAGERELKAAAVRSREALAAAAEASQSEEQVQ